MDRKSGQESVVDALYAHVRGSGLAVAGASGAAPVRPAVACVPWRSTDRGGLEVYAVQRAASLAFLGGYWAFPGGAVEADDDSDVAAAVREIREETGLDLPADPQLFSRAGQWVTPAFSPIRFDTQYFLVRVPEGAELDYRSSNGEHQNGRWISPAEAIVKWREAAWLVPSTVLRVLRALEPGIEGAARRCAEEAELARVEPRIWEVHPGLAVCPLRTPTLPPAAYTNCYFVGAEEVVVVDPASPYEEERAVLDRAIEALEERGRRIVEIWLTHHHLDHVADCERLAQRLGVGVAAHAATADLLGDRVTVHRHLADGERRLLAGTPPLALRVMHTPGHAPGHLCFVEEETGAALVGDLVATWGTILIDPSEGDMGAYLDSLARVRDAAPRLLLPAHGGVVVAARDKLDAYIAHRLWREERVCEALREQPGARPTDLVGRVYADVAPALHALAERSLLAHLAKLRAEGRARRVGDGWAIPD